MRKSVLVIGHSSERITEIGLQSMKLLQKQFDPLLLYNVSVTHLNKVRLERCERV